MNTKIWLIAAGLLISALVFQGCTCPRKHKAEKPKETACAPAGNVTSKSEFPARQTVLVEKTGPKQVIAGNDFNYTIKVTNHNKTAVSDVVLTESVPANFRFKSANPAPTSSGQVLRWDLGQLAAGSSKEIVVTGTAVRTGDLFTCTDVTLRPEGMCLGMAAIQPQLNVTMTGPTEAVLCDPATYKIIVKNTGTSQACNVVVKETLPTGMKTLDGKTTVEKSIGNLGPGESRELTVQARADKTGQYTHHVVATSDGGVTSSSADVTTKFHTPVLVVTKSGPNTEFVGKEITYTITVRNTGDAVSKNTILTEQLGRGTQFKSATMGGKMSSPTITWQLGDIAPGQEKTVAVTAIPGEKGDITSMSTAKAYCAENSASITTAVKGIPAMLLECIDLEDPIRIGARETYEIKVTNQGSDTSTNIVVKCEVPEEMEFISGEGPTAASADGRQISFAPLATLNAGQTVVFKVMTKGTQAGDVRFKVTMTSDQMTSPVMETESTRVY